MRLVKTVRRAHKGEELKSLEGTVWCLYLGHWKPRKSLFTIRGLLKHYFLLILGLSTRVAGAYERIGSVYSLTYKSEIRLWMEAPV